MIKITDSHLQNYKNFLVCEEKSTATIEKYSRDIQAFIGWCNEREITKELVIEYKHRLMELYAPTSVNSMLSSLNSFFEFNKWYELRIKALKIQKQIFANKDKELTKVEYERLLKTAKNRRNEQLFLLMQTICSSGIRVSELKFITVEAVKNKKAVIKNKGKLRVVFLPNEICKALLRYTKKRKISNGPVFITKRGVPLDRSNIWKLMKSLCKEANVKKEKVFPHNLRHLFARTFYSIQKDIVRLADILGHSSVETTRIYTMETGEIHQKQIQRLGLLRL